MLVLLNVGISGLAACLQLCLERFDDAGGGAADLHADDLAGQIISGLDAVLVGTQQDDVARVGIGHGEQHLLGAFLGDGHCGDDNVELLGIERGDDAVPRGIDELYLHTELGGEEVDDVGIVADDLAVLEELVRHVSGFHADHERTALLGLVQRIRPRRARSSEAQQSGRTCRGQHCASQHEVAPPFLCSRG